MTFARLTLLLATAPGDASPLSSPSLPSYGSLLLKTILALAIVIVLIYVLLRWGLRRLVPGARGDSQLRVLARQPLDGRRQVVLVQAYGRYLLLGVADGSVTLLAELTADEVAAAQRDQPGDTPRRSFAEVLRRVLGRTKTAPTQSEPPAPTAPPDEEDRDD